MSEVTAFSSPPAAPRWVKIAVAAAALLFLALAQRSFLYVPDDAYITYRYSRNVAEGYGPVFNLGAPASDRAEGFSCPLFMFLMALLLKLPLGLNVLLRARFFGILCGLVIILLAPKLAARARLPVWAQAALPLLLAAHASVSIQCVDGMETILQALLMMTAALGFLAVFDSEKPAGTSALLTGLAFAACALNRPEATLMGLLALAALIVSRSKREAALQFALAFLLPVAGWFLFRHAFYGAWLPNTYYAKSAPLDTAVFKGASYLLRTFFYFLNDEEGKVNIREIVSAAWWLLVLVGMCTERFRRFPAIVVPLMVAGQALFVLRSGGDWMCGWRYMAAVVPLLMLLALAGIAEITEFVRMKTPAKAKTAAVTTAALTAGVFAACLFGQWTFWAEGDKDGCISWASTGYSFRERDLLKGWKLERAAVISDWLNAHLPPGSVAAYSEMGVTPYFSPQIRFLDVDGLTDRGIATLPGVEHGQIGVEAHYLSEISPVGMYLRDVRRPDYILCGMEGMLPPYILDGVYPLSDSFPAPTFRSETNQANAKLSATINMGVWKRKD